MFGSIEDNMFAKLIYEKPVHQRGDSIFKKIKYWIKRRDYEKSVINPMINKLRNTSPSFMIMSEMSDFIKIVEKVFFYKNDMRKSWETGVLETRILSDNSINSDDFKMMILELQKEMVTIVFKMTRKYNEDIKDYDEIIEVKLSYSFGKKLHIVFKIINTVIEFDSVHDYNLMYNINIILQDAIANIFEEYYNLA